MPDFLMQWFQGLEKGIESLDQNSKEKIFQQCGRNCADTGIIGVYEDLYKASDRNLDVFFSRLNEMESISGEVIEQSAVYEISFPRCLCDLYTLGYVHSDIICECSRQSIIYVMKTLEPELEFQVEKLSTVLGGNKECRFRITRVI